MKRLLLLAVAGISGSAWGGAIEVGGYELKAGWTADGYFGFAPGSEDCGVWQATTGRVQRLDPEEYEAFITRHKLVVTKPSRTSPDGKAKAEVKLTAQTGEGEWKGGTYKPPSQSSAEFSVERDGKSTPSLRWYSGAADLETYWSPDGKYVAWVVRPSTWEGMDGSKTWSIGVGTGGTPRVQLLADKAILAKAVPAVTDAIVAAGFTPTWSGPALKARDGTVVYAADGYDEAAKKAAEAVPGGATVDKLSWKADAELVIAIGKSALKGGK
jgi:hypothetical protein